MNRLRTLLSLGIATAASVSLGLAGCGDNTQNTSCGAGTVLTGTQCVPDGSMICEQGTKFDPATHQCVLDPSACAAGTVLVGDKCVPEDDTLTADLNEAAEPNDAAGAGSFDVPAIGSMITVHGCITPRGGAADDDVWLMTVAAPAVVEITADGVGGLAAGYVVSDNAIATLPNYVRFGINLVGDMSKRQVYLPVAGTYLLKMDDSRALLTGEAAGNDKTCYYTTIKQVAMPAATTPTLPQTTAADSGNVKLFSYTPGMAGDIFDITQNAASTDSLRTAFIVRKNGTFYASATYDTANSIPPFYTVGGLTPTDSIDLVVDNVFNLALTPQDYTLDLFDIGAAALPTNGSVLTLTKHNGDHPNASYVDTNYSYFDVAANQIVKFDVTSSVAVTMALVRHDLFTQTGAIDAIAALTGGAAPATRTTFTNQFVRFLQPGRYYLMTRDSAGVSGETYTITSTLTPVTPTALTYGTTVTAAPLPASGSAFHTIDLATPEWIELAVPAAANWGAGNSARVSLYDLAGEGWMGPTAGANYVPVQAGTQAIGGTGQGRITLGDARDYVVRVEDTGTPDANPTYNFVVRDRAHVTLGAIVAGTPIVRTNTDTTAAGAVTRYLVTGTAGYRLDGTITPTDATVDISAQRRNADETIPTGGNSNTGAAGVAETFGTRFAVTPTWIAFSATNLSTTTPTNLSLNLTTTAPLPYTDICATGTVFPAPLDGTGDDDYSAVQTLPGGFGFNFFGAAQTDFIVGANGFMSFGNTTPTCSFGCFSNGTIPSATQPNNFIAGYWDDLDTVKICRKDEATKVTLQWTGNLFNTTTKVEFQIVLNSTGRIDFIYGPNHTATGSSATVGAEGAGGAAGVLVFQNTAGGTAPSSSYSITTP